MKKLLAMLLMVALLTPAAALAETLIMGSNCSFPPFEYIDDAGMPAGFDVEIGRLIAEKLGMDFVVEDMSFDGLLMALDSGKVDIVIAAMTIRPDRQEQADFSDSYFNAQQQIIMVKGSKAAEEISALLKDETEPVTEVSTSYAAVMELLKTKSVSVQDATTGYYMATETLGISAEKVAAFKNAADAIMELKVGRVDYVIIDTAPANVFVSLNEDLEILQGIQMPTEDYGVAIKKGNAKVLEAANAVLAEIKANGKYDELVAKYFASSEETPAK